MPKKVWYRKITGLKYWRMPLNAWSAFFHGQVLKKIIQNRTHFQVVSLIYFMKRKPFLLHWDQGNYTGIKCRNSIEVVLYSLARLVFKSTRSPDMCYLTMISVKYIPIPARPWTLFLSYRLLTINSKKHFALQLGLVGFNVSLYWKLIVKIKACWL